MSNQPVDHRRESLQGLPGLAPPRVLHDRLRVLASRESQRRRRRLDAQARIAHWREEIVFRWNMLMRPVAVPFAGGLASAIVLFGLLAPGFAVQQSSIGDVPTGLTTEAGLQFSFNMAASPAYDIVVDVVIDDQGRLVDYSIPKGQAWASDPVMVRGVENLLLCTKFTPATLFGQPASGRTRITLRRSHMEVRG